MRIAHCDVWWLAIAGGSTPRTRCPLAPQPRHCVASARRPRCRASQRRPAVVDVAALHGYTVQQDVAATIAPLRTLAKRRIFLYRGAPALVALSGP